MKLLNLLLKRPRGIFPLAIDQDSLEEMVAPLLALLMGVIVLFALI